VALDRLSRSLHSDVCDSDGLRDAAIHSTISGSGGRRDRAASNSIQSINDATWRYCTEHELKVLNYSTWEYLHLRATWYFHTFRYNIFAYLLGLLAMIKCSICSYQCENWYATDWWLSFHIYFSMGGQCSRLAWACSTCRLWHRTTAECGIPSWVTTFQSTMWAVSEMIHSISNNFESSDGGRNLQANFDDVFIWAWGFQCAAQLSLHDAPIFRLLLKIAVFWEHSMWLLQFLRGSRR